MADNTTLNSGTGGDTIASDDIAGVKHQRVKISLGADGSATDALGGAGAVAAGVQRVTLASDDPAVTALDNLDANTADYDTGAGTDTQVMLGIALPASGGAVPGGTSTNPIRTDPTGTTTQPVSGTVTANLAAGTNNIGDVDIVSSVPGTGATNLGKAEDGAHTSGDTGVFVLAVRNDTPNAALAGTDLDYSPISVYRDGSLRLAPPESDFAVLGSNSVKKYFTNAGAVTDGIIWSPAAGKRWYVTDIFVGVSAAATVTIEDDVVAGDVTIFKMEFAANSGWAHTFSTPWFSQEDAADLLITTSAGNVYVTVTGYEI